MRLIRAMDTRSEARSNRLTIYVVASVEAVARLCGKGCSNIAGFYVPRAGGSIAFTPRRGDYESDPNSMNADIVLFHEYAHHLMLENFAAAYPRWFVEGFAEFNATAKIGKDGSVMVGMPAQHRAYGLLLVQPLAIETLLDDGKAKFTPSQQDVFYGRAWLLTHMLTFEPARKGQLSSYLRLINEGKSSLDAARAAFGDLATLSKDMKSYLERRQLSGINLSAARLKVGKITLRTMTEGEADTMSVRMRSDRGVTREQATALLPEARRRAAPFDTDPAAQGVLAEAEYDAGNDALCEAAADRALAADPKDRTGLLYKGRARLRIAATAKVTNPAVWQEARSWFVKANRLDTNAAEPLMLYYTSFLAADQKPSASAVNGLLRAFELSPHDDGLRMLVVRQMLIDDRPAEARIALLPLAYNPHSPADNPASRLVAMIDAGTGGPAIIAAMEKKGKEASSPNKPAAQSSSSS